MQYIDLEGAQPWIGAQLSEDTKRERTIYTLHFGGGDGYTSFHQDGDGTDPDDGEPWPTGL